MSDANGTRRTVPVSDLQIARDAVVALVRDLSATLESFEHAQLANPGIQLALTVPPRKSGESAKRLSALADEKLASARSVRGLIEQAIASLERLVKSAEDKLASVRDELDEVSGKLDSDHVLTVRLAKQFSARANTLLRTFEARDVNEVHRWLLVARSEIERLWLGIRNPSWQYQPKSGIDFEAEMAARRRSRNAPPVGRVRCEPSTRSVFIDGQEIASGLSEDCFHFVEAVAAAYPEPITWRRIRHLKRIRDQNQDRVKTSLPASLALYLRGSTRGHYFVLPKPSVT